MKRSVSLTMIDTIDQDTRPFHAIQYAPREKLKPTRSFPTRSSSFTSSSRVELLRRRVGGDQRVRSSSSGSAGSSAVSTTPSTPHRVSSPTQRVLQLKKQAGMGEQRREIASERQYTTSLTLTKSCDNLEVLSLEEGESRDVVAMETGAVSIPVSFLSPCSPSGFDVQSRSRSLTPTSPHPNSRRSHITGNRPASLTLTLGKRRAMDQEEMDVGDVSSLPSSKARLMCVSPLHVAASSPCTSPICGSPLQKSFSAHHRASLFPPDPTTSLTGSTDSSHDGHTLISSDSEGEGEGELCLSPLPQHKADASYVMSSNVRCYHVGGDHYMEGRMAAAKLNLRFPEDSEEVLRSRRSSSESDANSMADQSAHTPLSPRGLKFLQFPTSVTQLASPVPLPHLTSSHATPTVAISSNHTASLTNSESALDKASSGSDSETGYNKEPKWKQRLRSESGTKPAALLRSSASSPLVNSAFSMTAGGGGAKSSKEIDMDELDTGNTVGNFGTHLFVPNQGSPHHQTLLIQDEGSLGFPPPCTVEMTDEF